MSNPAAPPSPAQPRPSTPRPRGAERSGRRLGLDDLLDLLQGDGLVAADAVRELQIKQQQRRDDRHPLAVVADCEFPDPRRAGRKLTIEALTAWLAEATQLAYLRIDPLSMDVDAITRLIPYAYASRLRILPVRVTPTEVTIATAEPWLRDWEAELSRTLPQKIVRVVANPLDIDRYLVEFYALARSVKASNEDRGRQVGSGVQNLEQLIDLGRAGKLSADDQHVVSIVDWLLNYACESRASDIHLEPRREHGNIRFRIDGQLHEVYSMPATVMAAVCRRIKILARMDGAEKRRPQDGRIKTRSPDGKEIELRVSSLPTAFGEKLVMRIFDPEVLLRDFGELGFNPTEAEAWRSMITNPNGIILVTGPTGSGKTTTLYSTLRQLAKPEVNVCTIEDPIELVEPAFNQMQVQSAIDLDFATGVRALLRQDPDIIMIGEIRDLETAEIAVQAALTGHLVLSTLHTNDAPSAITRLLDLGVPPYLIKATVLGVVAQRLVRTLCRHCKQPIQVDADRWQDLVAPREIAEPGFVCEPSGCLECRETGFLGRVGIYEMMPVTRDLRTLISSDCDLAELRTAAMHQGMVPLRIAGSTKVAEGLTTIDEVLRCAPAPLDE